MSSNLRHFFLKLFDYMNIKITKNELTILLHLLSLNKDSYSFNNDVKDFAIRNGYNPESIRIALKTLFKKSVIDSPTELFSVNSVFREVWRNQSFNIEIKHNPNWWNNGSEITISDLNVQQSPLIAIPDLELQN